MIKISRAINGITINGNEYVVDENNMILLFDNVKKAKKYLKENGLKDFRGINFEDDTQI